MMFGKKRQIPAYSTLLIQARDMKVGQSFVDIDGTIYTVIATQDKHGVFAVNAHTEDKVKPDGWFTRKEYLVIEE